MRSNLLGRRLSIKPREELEKQVEKKGKEIRGRKPSLTAAQIREAKSRWIDPAWISQDAIAKLYGISARTLQRYMARACRGKSRSAMIGDRK